MTNGVRWEIERLTRSVRRVAGRYGPVARATLVCKRSFMVIIDNSVISASFGGFWRFSGWSSARTADPARGRKHACADGHGVATKCLLRRQTESQRDSAHHRRLALDRQRVGKATPGKFCTRSWQARRARSDAPTMGSRQVGSIS